MRAEKPIVADHHPQPKAKPSDEEEKEENFDNQDNTHREKLVRILQAQP